MKQQIQRPGRVAVLASCVAAALTMTAPPARAQADAPTDAPKMQRVEITSSSIRRIDSETASPVQTLTREDIDKMGATTAAERRPRCRATPTTWA